MGNLGTMDLILWAAVPLWVPIILTLFLTVACFLLIGLILLQRGKGGGMAGMLTGTGGAGAFGARIGDKAMKATIYLAAIWLLLIMFIIKMVQPRPDDAQREPAITSSETNP